MPVTVKTFATIPEAASALAVRTRRALHRRRHAGDARAQRGRPVVLDHRAGPGPQPQLQSGQRRTRHHRRRGDAGADPARARSRLPASRGALDRRAGGAQHGRPSAATCSRPPRSAISPSRCSRSTPRSRCKAATARAKWRWRNFSPGANAPPAHGDQRLLRAAGQPRGVSLPQDFARQAEGRLGDFARGPRAQCGRTGLRRAHRLWRDGADRDPCQIGRTRAGRPDAR